MEILETVFQTINDENRALSIGGVLIRKILNNLLKEKKITQSEYNALANKYLYL